MLSQSFRNPNVELAAAGLFAVGFGFFYLLLGVNWFLNGKPLVAGSCSGISGVAKAAKDTLPVSATELRE